MLYNNNQGLPILIAAQNSTDIEKISGQLTNTKLSGTQIIKAETYAAALSNHLSEKEKYTAIIIIINSFSGEAMSVINGVNRNNSGPAIIVTDCLDTIRACQEQGQFFIIPNKNITPEILATTLPAAIENFNLNNTISNLETTRDTIEQRFHDMANHFSDWLWEIDKNLNIVFSSSRKNPSQKREEGNQITTLFIPEEKNRILDDFAELTKNPKPFYDIEYWSNDSQGSRICWSLTGIPIIDKENNITGFRGVAKDISTSKSSLDKVYDLSNNDDLTGLYNRTRFYDELERATRKAEREQIASSIFVMDLDHFQYINETHGHTIGNHMLVHTAKIIQNSIRNNDTLARIGGDEFGIILPSFSGEDAEYRANIILEALKNNPFKYKDIEIPITASIGIASYPTHATSTDDLITRVNIALSKAKQHGRNRIEQYTQEQNTETPIAEKLKCLDFLSKCLKNNKDKVTLHFQPIVPLNSEDNTPRYEVLVRMFDKDEKAIEAVNFIEIAEEFGLITQIDRIVCFRSIDLLKNWHHSGKKISLSVNISACSFDDRTFIAELRDKLRTANLPEGAVVFEITETAIIRDLQKVKQVITDLRRYGAHFALDDCGVGYSSFNYIKQLDLDFIKIDGTFVKNLTKDNTKDAAFVKALHDVASGMQILTVAESVEQEETVVELEKLGVNFVQGYFLGRPSPNLLDEDEVSTIH